MVEETFIAPTPKDAFILAKKKYGEFSRLKLLKARQILDEKGNLVSEIVVEIDEDSYFKSIDIDMEKELIEEIATLRDRVSEMKSVISGEKQRVIDRVSQIFIDKGIKKEWIDKIIDEVKDTSIASDERLFTLYTLESIDEALQIKEEDLNQQKIIMMVGTTGVGKTTTIAKLASRYRYLTDNRVEPILLNLDTHRAGAFEQLDRFANLLRLKHLYIKSIDEFSQILDTISLYPIALVDTAGISPYDTKRLIEMVEFIKSIKDKRVEISLVIPATAKYSDIVDIYKHFSFINIDSIILTKFDETRMIGDVIAFLIESQIPVSYMSVGQSVPDDLEVASREKLLERFVGELNI